VDVEEGLFVDVVVLLALEGLVLLEGLVEFALGGLVVAVEGEPGVLARVVGGLFGLDVGGSGEGVGERGARVAAGGAVVFLLLIVAAEGGGLVEEGGLGGGGSAHLPGEQREAFGEEVLEGGLGVEFLVEGVGEGLEVFAFVLADEGVGGEAGAQAVGLGVEGGFSFA